MKFPGDKRRAPRLRLLSRDELALWRHATADVRPRVPIGATVAATEPPPDPPAQIKALRSDPRPAPAPDQTRPAAIPAISPLTPLDRRLKRRLSSGKADVDDMIDLHGMTQAQAHHALHTFLWRAADVGARLVLVITGKGGWRSSADPHSGDVGVLRRQTPQWLRDPGLRAIVLSVEEAARPHGGSGALYVRLRRRQL